MSARKGPHLHSNHCTKHKHKSVPTLYNSLTSVIKEIKAQLPFLAEALYKELEFAH